MSPSRSRPRLDLHYTMYGPEGDPRTGEVHRIWWGRQGRSLVEVMAEVGFGRSAIRRNALAWARIKDGYAKQREPMLKDLFGLSLEGRPGAG